MMSLKTCVIVTPIYKPVPDKYEEASLRQNFSVLHDYDICLITHKDVPLNRYEEIAEECDVSVNVELFDKSFFTDVAAYNRLCLTSHFYRRFMPQYDYMLVCQPDVWIFRDELQKWLNRGYDYVGAPFIRIKRGDERLKILEGVGNGGLSLRRLQYCVDILSRNSYLPYIKPWRLIKIQYEQDCDNPEIRTIGKCFLLVVKCVLKMFGVRNSIHAFLVHSEKYNEDYVLSIWATYAWLRHKPHIPNALEAATFAIERYPSWTYSLIDGHLPFGCHAYLKYEWETFWQQYIVIK